MKKAISLFFLLLSITTLSAKELSRIHVEGKNFVDEDGRTIVFRGLCFSDPVKLISENKWDEDYFAHAAEWNANIVRFPIHPQYINQYGWDKTFEAIDRGIEWAKQLGMYVIIDWHSIGNLKDEKFTNPMYNTTISETFRFWRTVAQRYKDEPAVALYELFNEPTTGQKDLGKCTWDEWRTINEQIIDTIRTYDTRKVCLCAGFDWAYKLTDVKAKPVRRENIAYVSHPYPMKRDQPWEDKWEKDWGYVADTYPVICTEMGYCLDTEPGAHVPVKSTDIYGDHITKYLEQKGISFTIWCFDPHWAPTLFTDWNYTLSTQGKYFKKYLQSKYVNENGGKLLRVLTINNKQDSLLLRQKCTEFTAEELQSDAFKQLAKDMIATVNHPSQNGVGIAGPQVGVTKRVVAVMRYDKEGKPFEIYPNVRITAVHGDKQTGPEGCLSIPDRRGNVLRYQDIDIEYTSPVTYETVTENVKGYSAVIFQHETDHLDGVLYIDKLDDNTNTLRFDNGKVTWIKDMPGDTKQGKRVFNDTPDAVLAELHLEDGIPSSMSCFLMETDGEKVLFDAGLGGKQSLLHQSLANLGTSAEQIKHIFLTHLHADHIGGLIDGTEKIFPNAEIYLNKVEYDAWMAMSSDKNAQQKNILSIYADQLHLFTVDEQLPFGIQPMAAYGHTPGHTIFQKGNMLVIGDLMHGAALQLVYPEYCPFYDMDKTTAIESRKKYLKYAADNHLIMAGMHLPSPGFIK